MLKSKIYLLITGVMLLSAAAYTQDCENGAFGAPVFKYTRLAGEPALITGVNGGWIINKRIVLGAGYYVLTSNVSSDYTDTEYNQNLLLDFNYGGLQFEYLLLYESRYNVTLNMLLGGGGLSFYLNDINRKFSGRNLLVWEPQLNFEIELYEWLHADAGISYRMISAYKEVYGISENDLQGINILLTLKLGKY
jgi:hypothetical protein